VHKVKPGILVDAAPQGMRPALVDIVPAHVGNLQSGAGSRVDETTVRVARHFAKMPDRTLQQPQARHATVFAAVGIQRLQTDADTKEWLVA